VERDRKKGEVLNKKASNPRDFSLDGLGLTEWFLVIKDDSISERPS